MCAHAEDIAAVNHRVPTFKMDIPAIHEQCSSEEDAFQPPLQPSLAPEWNNSMHEFAMQSQPLGKQRHELVPGSKRTLRDVESHQLCVSNKNSEFEARGTDISNEGVPEKKMKTTMQAYEGYNLETQLKEQIQNESAVAEGEPPGNSDTHLQQPLAGTRVPDENVALLMQRISTEAREIYSKWQETFRESETFEVFCPARLDELIKEARALDNSLREQKERLKGRLQILSRTLL